MHCKKYFGAEYKYICESFCVHLWILHWSNAMTFYVHMVLKVFFYLWLAVSLFPVKQGSIQLEQIDNSKAPQAVMMNDRQHFKINYSFRRVPGYLQHYYELGFFSLFSAFLGPWYSCHVLRKTLTGNNWVLSAGRKVRPSKIIAC